MTLVFHEDNNKIMQKDKTEIIIVKILFFFFTYP